MLHIFTDKFGGSANDSEMFVENTTISDYGKFTRSKGFTAAGSRRRTRKFGVHSPCETNYLLR